MGSISCRSGQSVTTVKQLPTEATSLALQSTTACAVNTTSLLFKVVKFAFASFCKIGLKVTKSVCRESSSFIADKSINCAYTCRNRIANYINQTANKAKEAIESSLAAFATYYKYSLQELLATVNEIGTSLLHTGCTPVKVTYQPGDILYRRLKGVKGMFYHYGVYIGKQEVIQFMCSEDNCNEGILEKVSIQEFLAGSSELWVQTHFRFEAMKKKDICKKAFEIYQLDEEQEDWCEYNWRRNNCEHFANYCATNHKYSRQAIL